MQLNLPEHNFKIKKTAQGLQIFDVLRAKYVALTQEEWVRQNFVAYLIEHKGFPPALMNNEIALVQNGIKRRCDTLVADSNGNPQVIVEYKAPSVPITQNVFDQIVRYNMVLRAKYLIVSNGIQHYCCIIDYAQNTYSFLDEIPNYNLIVNC
ncbi:MAG: type I restriction enzyme HsdR N-terminal domain-containing protein [Muribaculaceae bacterium]